jgi:hypothetical protein
MSEGHEKALTVIAMAVAQARTAGCTNEDCLVALLQAAGAAAHVEGYVQVEFADLAAVVFEDSRSIVEGAKA